VQADPEGEELRVEGTHTILFGTWLQEEQDEHGHGKWEGKQEGKNERRITESKARQKESTILCTHLAD
jgi:hypothetical protein